MKKCIKCGMENNDDSVFCAGCGAALDQPAPAPEQPAAPAAPATDAYAYTAPAAAPAAPAEKNKATLWLILNIVATLFCCFGWLFSGLGIVFSAIGMSSYNKGNYDDMKKKAKLGLIFFIIGVVVGILGWIACFLVPALASAIPFLNGLNGY